MRRPSTRRAAPQNRPGSVPSPHSCARLGLKMYLIMAYCFGAFTTLLVLGLLWLGWQHNREEARQRKEQLDMFKRR